MWIVFFLENIHFAISLISALVFFAVFWLYFDAWQSRKSLLEVVRMAGFFLLSISFLIYAFFIESSILTSSILGDNIKLVVYPIIRILGYILVITSLILDPLQPKPKERHTA